MSATQVFRFFRLPDQRVGAIYRETGRVRLEQKKYDEAWSLLERGLAWAEQAGDVRGQGVTLREMGHIRLEQKKFDEAWSLLQKAIGLQRESAYARGERITLNLMGQVKLGMGEVDEAVEILTRGLAMAEEAGDKEAIQALQGTLRDCRKRRQTGTDRDSGESATKPGRSKRKSRNAR